MSVVCLSASNIEHARGNSTSAKVCRLIGKIVEERTHGSARVDIVQLVDYELMPCTGCGSCFGEDRCSRYAVFNSIYDIVSKAEALFIVSAHYAPIPAKLCMLLEKMEQLAFLKRFNDESYRFPLYKRPLGIAGHGGGTAEIVPCYRAQVIDTIANALSYPIDMDIVTADGQGSRGVLFPVHTMRRGPGSIFPVQEYDWEDIEGRLRPLVDRVLERCVLLKKSVNDAFIDRQRSDLLMSNEIMGICRECGSKQHARVVCVVLSNIERERENHRTNFRIGGIVVCG